MLFLDLYSTLASFSFFDIQCVKTGVALDLRVVPGNMLYTICRSGFFFTEVRDLFFKFAITPHAHMVTRSQCIYKSNFFLKPALFFRCLWMLSGVRENRRWALRRKMELSRHLWSRIILSRSASRAGVRYGSKAWSLQERYVYSVLRCTKKILAIT